MVTITTEGVYLLSGTLTDGQVVVNAGNTDKVQLVLSKADIISSTSATIYALEADKVFLTLAEGMSPPTTALRIIPARWAGMVVWAAAGQAANR